MNVSTEIIARSEATKELAIKYFYDSNPFALEMYFQYMPDKYIRELLAYEDTGDDWHPKTYHPRIVKYKLIADCMLRYYYYRFPASTTWESDEGIEDNYDNEFIEKRDFWKEISIQLDNELQSEIFQKELDEEPEAVNEFLAGQESRLIFFSRDCV